mgnify:CR=1 FL=1
MKHLINQGILRIISDCILKNDIFELFKRNVNVEIIPEFDLGDANDDVFDVI